MTANPLWSYLLLAVLAAVVMLALLPFLRWRSAVKQNRLLEALLESQQRTNHMLERLAAGRGRTPQDFERLNLGGDEGDGNDQPEGKDPWPPSTGLR